MLERQPALNLRSLNRRSRQPAAPHSLVSVLTLSALAVAGLCSGCPASAQDTAGDKAVAADPAAAASVVRWNGSLPSRSGETAVLRFSIYEAAEGGVELWSETQTVKVGAGGAYSVLLGAAGGIGLPAPLFQDGQPRWLEVQFAGGGEDERANRALPSGRSLLAAVPYALRAVNAETLAGRSAAEFVTQDDLNSAIAANVHSTPAGAPQAIPEGASPVTGSGTKGAIPVWTGSSVLGSSAITESGTKIGIGTTAPATALDLAGEATLRGTVTLPGANATSAIGQSSPLLELRASAYSKTSKAAVAETFAWRAAPAGNNTAAPSASLQLLFGGGTASPAATGLAIASNGQISFAAGQKFPGSGTITGIKTTSPLTGSGTSGSVALGLDVAALDASLSGVFAQLNGNNTFSGAIGATSAATAMEGQTTSASQQTSGVLGSMVSFSSEYDLGIGGGVWGDSGNPSSAGLWTSGVVGTATDSQGGVFINDSANWPSLFAYNYGTDGTGLVRPVIGKAGTSGLFTTLMAGDPSGTCGIGGGGNLSCTGQIKALVPVKGGAQTVETYAMQSPEPWIEDFGSGKLVNGVAEVRVDPGFADTIAADASYHVFLTPNGDSKGLYVVNKTVEGFQVRESGGGASTLDFDYRIVAKRRGYETERLTDVTERLAAEKRAGRPPAKIPGSQAQTAERRDGRESRN